MPTVVDPAASELATADTAASSHSAINRGRPEHVDIARAEGPCGVGLGDGHLGVTAQASFETHGSPG